MRAALVSDLREWMMVLRIMIRISEVLFSGMEDDLTRHR